MVVTSEALGICVSDLPRLANQKYGGWESNPRDIDCKSSALNTFLLSHTKHYSPTEMTGKQGYWQQRADERHGKHPPKVTRSY